MITPDDECVRESGLKKMETPNVIRTFSGAWIKIIIISKYPAPGAGLNPNRL
jgi:hypothetical protein